MKILFLLPTITILSSCISHDTRERDDLIAKQQKSINEMEEKMKQKTSDNTTSNQNSYSEQVAGKSQFFFIVLDVQEQHGLKNQSLYYTTNINEIIDYDEEVKYKLLDKVISDYKNSAGAMVWDGAVKNRRIFLFNSYEEASKAREKYMMQ